MLLEPGTILRYYHIDALLGRGGMGEVYRATHTRIGRTVAIKVLPQTDGGLAERFLNEARIQAGLHHPHIAELYDFFEFDERPCIVMEYLDGPSLRDLLDQQGPLSAGDALKHFLSLAQAVEHLHCNGIVHRDIKTANVKLTTQGQLKLLDFGIAKDADSPRLTTANHIVGTVRSLAPEQLRGQPASVASDVWALGVVLYEMITAKPPFDGSDLTECGKKIMGGKYDPPQIPAGHACLTLISRCLQVDARQRYRSVADLRRAVETSQGRPPAPPAHPKPSAQNLRPPREHWRAQDFWPAILSLVVVTAVLAWLGLRSTG